MRILAIIFGAWIGLAVLCCVVWYVFNFRFEVRK